MEQELGYVTEGSARAINKPLRIGLIGASRIAQRAIIEPARELAGVEVTAIAARSLKRASDYASQHGIPMAFGSYSEMLASPDIDLVYVATPPFNHAHLAVESLLSGKAVLAEKPFALDAAEAKAVLDIARELNLPVFEAMHSLHHQLRQRLMDILADLRLGRMQHISGSFRTQIRTSPGEYRWHANLGGGALLDLGIYPLAWCRTLAGEPLQVTSATAELVGDVDGALTADLLFTNGVRGRITCSMLEGDHEASLTIDCEHGKVMVQGIVAPQRGNRITVDGEGYGWSEAVDGLSSYAAQLAAVRDSLSGERPFPLPADDFVASMAAIDMIRTALPEG